MKERDAVWFGRLSQVSG